MVNGTLIETALDASRSPMAIPSGFLSGIASATILRNEDALLVVSWVSEESNRLHIDFFGVGEDEDELDVTGSERRGGEDAKCLRPRVRVTER